MDSGKKRAYDMIYRVKHSEKIIAYRKKHQEKNRKYALAYRVNHREEHRAYQAQYQREHPAVMAAGAANYRHRKRWGGGSFSRIAWAHLKALFGHRCAYCGRSDVNLTQDHVIPVSKGGWHFSGNIVPACRSCNSAKGNVV